MTGLEQARPSRRRAASAGARAFAALDLGTNNCRLLIAERAPRGFRVVDSYSSVSRLGEGLSRTGRLSEEAMARTLSALRVCAQKLATLPQVRVRAVATQACRAAANGQDFLAAVRQQTGLSFEVVAPEEEARLSVLGCASLVDPNAAAALVLDIGGGSTELSFVATRGSAPPAMLGWTSLEVGVVTLAERFVEPDDPRTADAWWRAMRREVEDKLAAYADAPAMAAALAQGGGHIVGTSGALSSLGGVHLRLPRYLRSKVDGLWLACDEVALASDQVRAMTKAERAAHPCIGAERADLIVPGAAIVAAVCAAFPSPRVRVADRGLREGVLLEMMAQEDAA